jgi:hypothetical protein
LVVANTAAGAPACSRELATFVVFCRVVVGTGEDATEAENGENVDVAVVDLVGRRLAIAAVVVVVMVIALGSCGGRCGLTRG